MNQKYILNKIQTIISIEDKTTAQKELETLIEEVKISSYFQACNDISRQNYKNKMLTQKTIELASNVVRLNSKVGFE